MADPRLAWRQLNVASPNVSGLMRGANDALNNAADAASSILGRYEEGQMNKADAEVANELAALDTQDEIDAYFANGGLNGRNISPEMMQSLMGRQGDVMDYANTRSSIGDRDGRLGIAQDVNARSGEAFGWQRDDRTDALARRDWQRDNAGMFIEGEQRAFTNGTAFSSHIDRTESGGAADQYDTLFGHRNRNNGVRVSQMTIGEAGQFAAADGEYGRSVISEIGRVATPMGKFQIVGSTLRGLQKDLNLPADVPFSPAVQEQLGTYLAQRRIEGRSPAAARAGLRAEWEGFKNVSDAELDQMIGELRQLPTVNRDSIIAAGQGGGNQGAPQGQPGFRPTPIDRGGSQYAQAMAASGLFGGQEVLGAIDHLRDAATSGQAEIDEQRLQYQNDVVAGLVQQAVNSPNALTTGEAENIIRDQLLSTGEFSNSEAVTAARQAAGLIESSAGLSGTLSGGSLDAGVVSTIENAAANTVANATRRVDGTDQARAVADISRYNEGGEPHKVLESDLEIPNDAETLGSYRSEMLRRLVNDYADEFGVEPSVVAVAMRDAYVSDPGDDERSSFWYNSDMTLNTLERRFDKDAVEAAIAQLDPNARRDLDRQRGEVSTMKAQLEQNASQQKTLMRRLNKLDPNDPRDADEYQALQQRLDRLVQAAAQMNGQVQR